MGSGGLKGGGDLTLKDLGDKGENVAGRSWGGFAPVGNNCYEYSQ